MQLAEEQGYPVLAGGKTYDVPEMRSRTCQGTALRRRWLWRGAATAPCTDAVRTKKANTQVRLVYCLGVDDRLWAVAYPWDGVLLPQPRQESDPFTPSPADVPVD